MCEVIGAVMAEKILCAVDEPEEAARVLDAARWLADSLHASVTVVHAVQGSDRDVEELIGSVRSRLADKRALVRLVDGSPAKAIMQTADAEGAELVVVGSRSHAPLRSAVLGSVSRELVAGARCPVVVVPSGGTPVPVGAAAARADGSVVCGVDGSDDALAAAAFAGRLATRLGCRLIVVHARQNLRAVVAYPGARMTTPPVTGQPDAVRKQADAVVQRAEEAAGVEALGVVEPGPPAEVLESVADREAALLTIIAARGVGGFRAAMLGSVAAELCAAAARPVVVLSKAAVAAVAQA